MFMSEYAKRIEGKTGLVLLAQIAALRLIVETMSIYKAVPTGNRNIELYRETARSNWKKPSIATMPDYSRTTVFILTPLIFRYHLPIKGFSKNYCFSKEICTVRVL